ncbi:ankyrin repeat-containing protein, partial [Chthonomonas calidirosea]|uniref:ankyrin repeat domain-containing protein n=1 Tax=Chthonomonas calidirosea TaxID=454171 RepID=UPI0006DD495B
AKANVNLAETRQGFTPLYLAVLHDNVPLCRLLLGAGADPNREDGLGECPLNMAVATLSAPLCRLLVQAGADPNHRDKTGRTPLEAAEAMHDPEILSALRSKGKVKKEAKRGTNKGRDGKSQ